MRKRRTNFIVSKSAVVKEVNYDLWLMVRSFILRLVMGECSSKGIEVERVFRYIEPPGILGGVAIAGYDAFDNLIAEGRSLFALVSYHGERYILSFFVQDGAFGGRYMISVISDTDEGSRVEDLLNELMRESVSNSGYRGKILRLYRSDGVFRIRDIERFKISLDDIFIDEGMRMDIEDFIDAVVNLRFGGMRYLFVGEPGTGKTDTIKAVISHCHSRNPQVTTLLVDSSCGIGFGTLFEYAQIFKPCLICIDDIDLIIGTRERFYDNSELSSALQFLDGFVDFEGLYLIATTNDRALVDEAARRPGRFDLILEFGALESRFYPNVVLRETGDEKLADVFRNDFVVGVLSGVSGAFIVNLVKYLMRPRFSEARYDPDFVVSVVRRLRSSFDFVNQGRIGFLE